MSSLTLPSTSTYSRSLLLLLASMDIAAANMALLVYAQKINNTLYISFLLWVIVAYLFHGYDGKKYMHLRSISYYHLLTVAGHTVVCLMLSIVLTSSISYTSSQLACMFTFWGCSLLLKYALYTAYLLLRRQSVARKRYLIVGHNAQASALRKYLKQQYGDYYYYCGIVEEPYNKSDLNSIAALSLRDKVHTIYFSGDGANPLASSLYQMANKHYIYFHYVLAHNPSRDFRWQWAYDHHPSLNLLSCSPRREIQWKRRKAHVKLQTLGST
ncbi:hypothetical protein WJR50_07260 [Catalinimonas sp. 4WD22]|uniref:nucleoside-diphosphate sugar epimerase/dehydratase n=1 Tax=Catalinimonas locisalis TaxID=3133978 RepID=UPI0031017EAC